MTIAELLRRVDEVDVKKNLPKFVYNTSGAIAELNRHQLYSGKNSDDTAISPEYNSDFYASFKNSKNQLPGYGVPDLKDTGDFYDGFDVIINGNEYRIFSTDEKSESLINKYGDMIFGLSKDSKSEYAINVLYEEIKEYITSVTGLVFR